MKTIQMSKAYLNHYLPHQTNMKRENMKFLLIVSIFTLFFCLSINGQTSSGKTILEVYQSSFGMVVDEGNYLFVRVLNNGQVQYQKSVIKNNKQKFELRKYNLSAVKLQELKNFLNSAKVEQIAEKYSPDVPTLDHYIGFDIKITRNTKSQVIKLTNYNPNLRNVEEDEYPRELIELACRIKALRYNTGFWLLKNDCVLNKKEFQNDPF